MPLDADQLTDLRADLADTNNVFSEAELQRAYTRANESYDHAKVILIEQLVMNAAKFSDYTVGMTSEQRSQVFEHLKDMLTYFDEKASQSQQVAILGLQAVPPRRKDRPYQQRRKLRLEQTNNDVHDWEDM